jgi:hypothetical protein
MQLASVFAVLFSTPLAAIAAAGGAVAVPIVIHLLNRKRYVVVPWAAMRFLLAAQKKNVRRLKLEQWLLLAVRTLLVLFVVLAMAAVMPWFEPVWQRLFPGAALSVPTQGRTHRIVVLDASFTMAARRPDDVARFEAAKAQAKEVLAKAGPGDGFSLVLLSSPAQVIVPGPVDDRDKVAREIDELRLPHGSADVPGGLHAVGEMVAKPLGRYARRDVYVVSDWRRSTWPLPTAEARSADAPAGGSGTAEAWRKILTGARVIGIDVAGAEVENVAVTGLTLGDPLPLVHTDLAVQATVHNHGKHARKELPVELLVGKAGDKFALQPVSQQLVEVGPNTAKTVTFPLVKQNQFREPGQYVLQVRVGDDDLKLDNARAISVSVRDTIPVMVVNGKPSPEPLDRASGFLVKALNPFPEAERSPESPAAVRVLTPREFQDAGLGDLFRPDAPVEVVFLCDLPTVGGNEAARLEAHLKRGGSVVLALGPNAGKNLEAYNRVLFNDGKGLLPGPLVAVRRAGEGQSYSLFPDPDAFKVPPLAAFRSEEERGSFSTPRFGRYVRMDLPPNGPARRLFSFVPTDPKERRDAFDPAVVEWPKHRGRVVVITTGLNEEWNDWGKTLSFAPFVQELLRFAVTGGPRRTVQAGEPLEDYVPNTFVGLTASVTHEDGMALDGIPVTAQDEAGLIRIPAADRAGVYRVSVGGKHDALFAVNVPVVSPTGGAESDLRRVTGADFKAAVPEGDVQIAGDVSEVQTRAVTGGAGDEILLPPEPRGPAVARILLFLVVGLMTVEVVLAWWYGSARAGQAADPMRVKPGRWLTPLWLVPFALCVAAFGIMAHAIVTGEFLGFLPNSVREPVERALEVPQAAPGEGTRWRLESAAYLTGDRWTDQWLTAGLLLLAGLFVWRIYRRERTGTNAAGPLPAWRSPLIRLGGLRIGLYLLALGVLLPQARLAFEREGWPDVVIVIDESRSMAVVDTFRDPVLKSRADELKREWAKLAAPKVEKLKARAAEINTLIAKDPDSADAVKLREELTGIDARVQDLNTPHRLNLVKALLATGDGAWVQTFVGRRQMRVHVYRVAGQATQMAELNDREGCEKLLADLDDVMPTGESSQLGTGVESVLKAFRGGSLNAIVMFTDGVTTKGDDMPAAGKLAARAGVPLYLIGVGDAAEPPDLILDDLRAEDSVNVNDRLVIEARVAAQGPGMPDSVPVTLSEIKDGRSVEITRETVRLDPTGKPVKVRFVHQPKEAGEKTFVVEIPVQPEESDTGNNRIEHRVTVLEAKKLRVLLVEGYPRYDFRYVKALFEREAAGGGVKAIEVDSYLLSAHPDHPKQDRTSISRFPTPEELRKYDVVILGDVDPRNLPRAESNLDSLAKYVRDHGGGLLMLAGEQSSPHNFRNTPLADVMPVVCDGPPPEPSREPIRDGFRPRLTPAGQSHPLFRFKTEEAESAEVWNQLPPLYWSAKGYRRKLAAEVLAVHPDRPAEPQPGGARDEFHPLVLQQFVGAGRVLFIGFDDTWRWRLRESEVRFNQFWLQAVRALARGRVGRIEVRTDRKVYRRDDPVRVTVRFPDDAPAPEGPVRVTVDRRPPKVGGGEPETQTVQLAPREGTRATFEALLTRTPEGDYAFTLSTPAPPGTRPKTEARILPPPGELDRIQLNEQDLQRAARESRGAYYALDKADEIPDEMPSGPRVALDQPCEPLSLWNHWGMFALVLGLLTAEWVMRKKWRLL